MYEKIGRWSFFLGIGGATVAIVWRVLTLVGLTPKDIWISGNHPLTYEVVLKGAFLSLFVTVACAACVYLRKSNE